MTTFIILIFVIGYLAITLEHPLKLDKAVPALLMGTLMWALLSIGFNQSWFDVINYKGEVFSLAEGYSETEAYGFKKNLMHHFSKIGEILFFLIGAMTIVEIVDLHRGFGIIKKVIKPKSKQRLLWVLGILAFVLSAIIDNLTATIILITLLRKILAKHQYRVWYAAMIIIAANAGGAWSPIGDVTTTMLWIGGKVTAVGLSEYLIIPSLACFVVPFFIATKLKPFRGRAIRKELIIDEDTERLLSSKTMLYVGLGAIVFVPVFKMVTGLPPYIGMMFSLGLVWLVSEYVKPVKNLPSNQKYRYSTHKALSKIEFSSILFFLGILLAVAALESLVFGSISGVEVGTLRYAAESISNAIPNMDVVVILLGMLSALIDNVPMVAATMGMYTFEVDSPVWHFIAYSAGTGGSLLVIGSAAGVAAMGIEKIDFIWYLKKITWLALVGFLAGAGIFVFIEYFFYN
ncbi:sodium:proton antiporter NhaD [Psychroflexus sp. ALD_RP9]|uniref:sodium:proton antiporter NhaD n=1 Tax=Psychroflexus sp. ALD_RP9 TaxID=2777186 RepID=UPI001A8F5DE8|nr:sodium:proton antiporter NhaD [Psychroflexus sp. ALD_RP9]QSS97825.1 sodium:proton antiporter NhaD [Psychroflexus sp. ALD_RP9]